MLPSTQNPCYLILLTHIMCYFDMLPLQKNLQVVITPDYTFQISFKPIVFSLSRTIFTLFPQLFGFLVM